MSPTPRVSIGMPVFNGARFLAQAIESILGQTFRDFELVVSDNGSTDDTAAILDDFAARDGRVKVHHHETNRGATWNYEWVRANTVGELYKWAAHDDVLAPTWLERCVEALDANPDAVLAFTGVASIDEHGTVTRLKHRQVHAESPDLHHRFRQVISVRNNDPEAVFGLMRRSALDRTRGQESYCGSDRVLLTELAIEGRFVEVPEVLFFNRDHPNRSVRSEPDWRRRRAWFDPAAREQLLPAWRIGVEDARAVARASSLRFSDRVKCWTNLPYWAVGDLPNLVRDFGFAAGVLASRARLNGRAPRDTPRT